MFCEKVKNIKLLWLLNEEEYLWDLVVQAYETKGMYTINTTWLHSRLVNEITKRNRLKRKGVELLITQEEIEMFEESGYDPIDQLEQYDFITKTYGENYAKYLVSGEYDFDDLQNAEGVSRATLFRRLQKMRDNNE